MVPNQVLQKVSVESACRRDLPVTARKAGGLSSQFPSETQQLLIFSPTLPHFLPSHFAFLSRDSSDWENLTGNHLPPPTRPSPRETCNIKHQGLRQLLPGPGKDPKPAKPPAASPLQSAASRRTPAAPPTAPRSVSPPTVDL